MTLTELLEKKSEIKTKIAALLQVAEDEARDLNETEQADYDALVAELANIENEIASKEQELRSIKVKAPKPQNFSILNAIRAEVEHRSLNDFENQVVSQGRKEMERANLTYTGNIVLPVNYRASI
jgi:HK97 family phage major capsid protein